MTKKVTTERRTAITILKIKKTPNIGKQINTGVSNRTVPLCCPSARKIYDYSQTAGLKTPEISEKGQFLQFVFFRKSD
jgi:uncharacterized protein YlaN (UPF0358 family)